MLAELPTADDVEDDTEELEGMLDGALVELWIDEKVDDGAVMFETSTGHTLASTPPIVKAVQLLNGALGKPA